jgi:hypothetical protein
MDEGTKAPLRVPCVVQLSVASELKSEARLFALRHGPNAYSDYLLKYGRRPDATEAAGIGRLIGFRVRASDGTLRPELSKSERERAREEHRRWKARRRKLEHLARLSTALAQLAENEDDPASVIDEIGVFWESDLLEKLEKSVQWLNRFAEELSRNVHRPYSTS